MGEGFLFDVETMEVEAAASAVKSGAVPTEITPIHAEAEDVPRLAGQAGIILERLRCGPATNRELSDISLKYTSRISDIRRYLRNWFPFASIKNTRHADQSGLTIYTLEGLKEFERAYRDV